MNSAALLSGPGSGAAQYDRTPLDLVALARRLPNDRRDVVSTVMKVSTSSRHASLRPLTRFEEKREHRAENGRIVLYREVRTSPDGGERPLTRPFLKNGGFVAKMAKSRSAASSAKCAGSGLSHPAHQQRPRGVVNITFFSYREVTGPVNVKRQ